MGFLARKYLKENSHSSQIKRIKAKLKQAKIADFELRVFGASSHKYHLNKPLSALKIKAFERKHGFELPTCYKAFINGVGNGGNSYVKSGAGPFYGIYPLGYGLDQLVDVDTIKYLKQESILTPAITDKEWEEISERLEDDTLSDEEYDEENGKLYAGILPIGTQGCTYLHGIVLNGPYKGRVVNLDMQDQKPRFTFENNFLDWYERWLDEVISGDLVSNRPTWFGYGKGGSDEALFKEFQLSEDEQTRKDCLVGILRKEKISAATLIKVEEEHLKQEGEIKELLSHILTKNKPAVE